MQALRFVFAALAIAIGALIGWRSIHPFTPIAPTPAVPPNDTEAATAPMKAVMVEESAAATVIYWRLAAAASVAS